MALPPLEPGVNEMDAEPSLALADKFTGAAGTVRGVNVVDPMAPFPAAFFARTLKVLSLIHISEPTRH